MPSFPKKEPVYILIPVHNRKKTTLACLERLQKTGALLKYHAVVIDDGSTDGTSEAVRQHYPEALIVLGNGELWWTGAMAVGMEYAAQNKAEYFIWLNDDCVPVGDALFRLIDYMRVHPNTIAAPTCYVETPDGELVRQDNAFLGRKSFAAHPGQVLSAEGLSGWCVGMPAAVFHKIGVPDAKKFPHYSGDDTYIYRATRKGFQACVIGDVEVRLLGTVHPKLDFRNHFSIKSTPFSTFHSIFLSKKSPYRLKTKFFYFMERYGFCIGMVLFISKFLCWIWKWIHFQTLWWSKSDIFSRNFS